ncbi:response regulator [Aliihoeflea sp. PC F10.4]
MTEPPAGSRVLVVDDSRVNRMLLRRILEGQGHRVDTAENGREALATLRAKTSNSFDLILLDIVMPQLDGYQTLSSIKADAALQHLPVIMITSIEDLDSAIRCIRMGATDYLPKPFNVDILKARIDASLSAKRLRDLEREYLEQVDIVTSAATALEKGNFAPAMLDGVVERADALGHLARVFLDMANEIQAREARMQRQVQDMRIEIDEARRSTKVAEITGSTYFRHLSERAGELRTLLNEDQNKGKAR